MGAKIEPQKNPYAFQQNPGPKINPQKIPCRVNFTFQTHKSQAKEIKNSVTLKLGHNHGG